MHMAGFRSFSAWAGYRAARSRYKKLQSSRGIESTDGSHLHGDMASLCLVEPFSGLESKTQMPISTSIVVSRYGPDLPVALEQLQSPLRLAVRADILPELRQTFVSVKCLHAPSNCTIPMFVTCHFVREFTRNSRFPEPRLDIRDSERHHGSRVATEPTCPDPPPPRAYP
jgi:hypothetical protein